MEGLLRAKVWKKNQVTVSEAPLLLPLDISLQTAGLIHHRLRILGPLDPDWDWPHPLPWFSDWATSPFFLVPLLADASHRISQPLIINLHVCVYVLLFLSPWRSLECTWEIQKNSLEMWEMGREISLLLTLWKLSFLQLTKGQPPLTVRLLQRQNGLAHGSPNMEMYNHSMATIWERCHRNLWASDRWLEQLHF